MFLNTKKIGESQVIDFFSTALRDELHQKFGRDAEYSLGNFSGSQDRKFADFFAGTNSSCILIEFKEYRKETKDELKKPLRKKLCKELTKKDAKLSRSSHFIAYRSSTDNMQINLVPYVDEVCPSFSIGCPPLLAVKEQEHNDFIDKFLSGNEGVNLSEFLNYAGHLNSIAGGIPNGASVPFNSIFYSRNNSGKIIGIKFDTLGELQKLLSKKPKTPHSPQN